MGDVIVNRAALDYLTLTTYHEDAAERLFDAWSTLPGGELGNLMQYQGLRSDQFFCGRGEQQGRPHWLFRASGALADDMLPAAIRAKKDGARFASSRLDVQATAEEFPVDLRTLADYLRKDSTKWNRRGRKPRTLLEDSDDGLNTLYMGTRRTKNGVLYRTYVKEAQKERFVRFECEYKGKRATEAFNRLGEGELADMAGMIGAEFKTLPDYAQRHLKPIAQVIGNRDFDRVRVVEEPADCWRALDWLQTMVLPAMKEKVVGSEAHDVLVKTLLEFLGETHLTEQQRAYVNSCRVSYMGDTIIPVVD